MNMEAASVPWSAEQREWLQALGHDVLMLAPAGVAADPPPVAERAGNAATNAVKPHASAKLVLSASPLLRALARAAGRSEQDAEFLQALPDIATLRGNPVVRRALWPRLRALRKRTPP